MNKNFLRQSTLTLMLCLCLGMAFAQAPSGYYKSAEGLSQKALLQQLCTIVGPHTAVGYDGLWNVYADSDVRPGTSYIWDMYSTSQFRVNQKKCGNYSYVGDCYNREHSFPKSWFDNASPMVSDAFHIYPTDGKVNGQRSNYPYGECSNGTTLASHGGVDALGKLGKCTFPGYTGTVFEPDDEYKGDFARTYFYMAACYNNKISSWSSPMLAGNNYPCYTTWAINLLMKWNEQDPVSQKEIDRNNAVYKHQKNRNPFIDHPELADYIWGDKQDQKWYADGTVATPKFTSPYNGSTLDLGLTSINTTLTYTVTVKAQDLTQPVTVAVSGTGFSVSASSISAADANKGTSLQLSYASATAATATGTLTLTSGTATTSVTLTAEAIDGIPALPASEVSQSSFVANWVDVSKDGSNYSLSVFAADGTTLLEGYPKTVAAASGMYEIDGLDALTTYKYQLTNAAGLESNVVTVTTLDLDREILLEIPAAGLVFTTAPNTASEPIAVTVWASQVEEDQIQVVVTNGFEISTDKATWSSSLSVDTQTATTIGADVYVRLKAMPAGTYTGTIAASTATVDGVDLDMKATVTAPITFFEDFEPTGEQPYNTFEYTGSACKWSVVNAGLANRTSDKFHDKQSICTAKNGARSITMLSDKQDGAGEVTFYAAVFGTDKESTVELSYSVDQGSNWIAVKSFVVSNKVQLEECKATVNIGQPVRFRIVETEGGRVNLDDVTITAYTSSVTNVEGVAKWDAYCRGGQLHIETAEAADINVYTIDAREVYNATVSGETVVNLPEGYYIVVNGNDSRKVAIK